MHLDIIQCSLRIRMVSVSRRTMSLEKVYSHQEEVRWEARRPPGNNLYGYVTY